MATDIAHLGIAVDSRGVVTASNRLDGMTAAGRRAERGVDRFARKSTSDFARVRDSIFSVQGALAGLGVGFVAGGIIGATDQFNLLNARIAIFAENSEAAAMAQRELVAIANRTRADLFSTAEMFSRIAQGREELGRSTAEILAFTEQINQLVLLSGANATEAKAAIIQLAQGMASGELRGEELRSVMEQLPEVARTAAREMGMGMNEFREASYAGKVSAQEFFDAIMRGADTTNARMGDIAMTVGQAWTILKNHVRVAVAEVNNALGGNAGLASLLVTVAENLGLIAKAAGVLALIIGARLFGAVTSSTAAWISNTVEIHRNNVAKLAAAEASAATAAADLAAARAHLQATAAFARESGQLHLISAARLEYAAATNTATAATTRLAAAQRAASVAATAATGVMAGLRSAMALLGGPAGVILLGVTALGFWATSADRAEIQTAELSREVRGLAEDFDTLTRAQQQNAINQQSQVVANILTQLEEAQARVNELSRSRTVTTAGGVQFQTGPIGSPEEITAAQARVDSLNQSLGRERNLLQELNNAYLGLTPRKFDLDGYTAWLDKIMEETGAVDVSRVKYTSLAETLGLVEYRQERMNELRQEAAQLTASVMTEQERYNTSLQHYQAFLDQGLISQQTYNRLVAELDDRLKDGTQGFDFMEQAATQAARSMQDSLAQFFMNMDEGVDGMLKGFVDALRQMTAQMLAFQTLKAAFGGTDIGAFFGVNGAAGSRASGGSVQAGKKYQVAEFNRPEFFIPQTNGKVVPADKMGKSINITVNQDNRGATGVAEIVRFGQQLRSQLHDDFARMSQGYAPA